MKSSLRSNNDGWYKCDKDVAEDIYDNYERNNYDSVCAEEDLFGMVDYLNNNYTNVNGLAVECALECYYYDFVGAYNKNIENEIKRVVEKCVKEGKITEW